jgi:hypothetical protein
MVEDHLIIDLREGLVRAFAAFDLRKLTDSPYKLVRAGRSVTGLPGSLAHEPGGKYVCAALEQGSKEPDFLYWRRRYGEICDRQGRSEGVLDRNDRKFCTQGFYPGTDGRPLAVKLSKECLFADKLRKNLLLHQTFPVAASPGVW